MKEKHFILSFRIFYTGSTHLFSHSADHMHAAWGMACSTWLSASWSLPNRPKSPQAGACAQCTSPMPRTVPAGQQELRAWWLASHGATEVES